MKVQSRAVDSSTCFKASEVFNCFPDSCFDHVWIILGTIFCSKDSSRIQEKVENMKNLKLQKQGQSSKKQVEKRFKILQNLEKWMIFDKSDRYYPFVLGFFPLFWVNFEVASAIFSIFRKKTRNKDKVWKKSTFHEKSWKNRHRENFLKIWYMESPRFFSDSPRDPSRPPPK